MKDSKNHRVFPFGQKVYLKIKFCSPIGFMRHAILGNKDEQGKEDRFKRNNRSEQAERIRIERLKVKEPEVCGNP